MKTIIVNTQEELDALPKEFDEPTIIQIYGNSFGKIHINKMPKNAKLRIS